MAGVGVVVNPWAGKDLRRLHAPVGHVSDTHKIGIVRRITIGALDAGASRVVAARDVGRIAERAVMGVDGAVLVDGPGTGSALDTRRGAAQLVELGCVPIVVLGGDGTSRDVVIGAPVATIIPVSTGTNNVFPTFVDGSSAGTAAGLLERGELDVDAISRRAKVLHAEIRFADGVVAHDIALVDVAMIDDVRAGARAVVRPDLIRTVIAAIATPSSTGLAAIAGRVHPISRHTPGAVVVRLGGTRAVRVPIVPGSFHELGVDSIDVLDDGGSVQLHGPGVLAYDGERERVLPAGATATVTVRTDGPLVVDVDRALHCAAARRLFDVLRPDATPEAPHGD